MRAKHCAKRLNGCWRKTTYRTGFPAAFPFFHAFALVLGAHFHTIAAVNGGTGSDRAALALCYTNRVLPAYRGLLDEATAGGDDLAALRDSAFGL